MKRKTSISRDESMAWGLRENPDFAAQARGLDEGAKTAGVERRG